MCILSSAYVVSSSLDDFPLWSSDVTAIVLVRDVPSNIITMGWEVVVRNVTSCSNDFGLPCWIVSITTTWM